MSSPSDLSIVRNYFGAQYPQVIFEYNADGTVAYCGIAPRGAAITSAEWMIEKYTYTNGLVTQIQTAEKMSIWNNRASLTYA